MPDDRLIELNGVSLVGRSNADTMKVLREALRSRGPSPGCVDLVVTRCRAAETELAVWESTPRKRAQLTDGQDSPSTTSNTSSVKATSRSVTATANKTSHPPVLRNTSYYMANGDTSLYAVCRLESADAGPSSYVPTVSTGVSAPTITGGRSETFLIETEGGGSFRSSSSNSSSGRSSRNGRQLRLVCEESNTRGFSNFRFIERFEIDKSVDLLDTRRSDNGVERQRQFKRNCEVA